MLRTKHVWLVMGALSLGVPMASAQTFEAGAKVGFAVTGLPHAGEVFDQIAFAPGGQSNESSSRIGLTGGGYVRFPISDRLAFQPEALFVMKGATLYQASSGNTVKVRINYLDVPLLIRYRTTNADSTDPDYIGYVLAGPSFGIKLGDNANLDASGSQDLSADSALKSLDLGLAFGGGIEFRRYLIEGRLTVGLTDVASTTFTHADSLRNRAVSVLFGVKLH